jgi:hypothetical protein
MRIEHTCLGPSVTRDIIDYAITFYSKEFEMEDMRDVIIDVKLINDAFINEDGMPSKAGDRIEGAIFFEDDVYDTATLERFSLGINPKCDIASLFTIIAHEMVHIWQYLRGALRTVSDEDNLINYWEGYKVPNETPYDDLMWEKEAYELQDSLVESLCQDPKFLELVVEINKE